MKTLMRIIGWALVIVAALMVAGWFSLKRPDLAWADLDAKYAIDGQKTADLGNGMVVRYLEAGDAAAPTILLVHGYTASVDGWRPWMQRLSAQYHVIALDLPGHGLTRAPDGFEASPAAYAEVIERFAAKLQLNQFVLGGHSMGGWAAWEYALVHPERLQGLILVDSSGWPDDRPAVKAANDSFLARALHNPVGRAVLEPLDARNNLKNGLLAAYEDDRRVTDAVVDRYWAYNRAPGHRRIITDLYVNWDAWPMADAARLAAIRTPTLILQGEDDVLVPLDAARRFDAAIPDSRLIVYQGQGHMIPEEAPDASAADVMAFLGGLKLGEVKPEETSATPARPAVEEHTLAPATGPLDPSLIFQ
jgi:pimeloyl-ACP methyl ester carboxylesterase